ncbi:hypothetical protein BT63DRAFT_162084 [Microthyrium microscopicum]|uniref:Uncharacterized protein n=1 Tax=Microthyrium microscopicum TaxID=703497 RepID=A0A6A6URT3_9PEZI|nr:hypothetical protein BT63DRAFT_162084 [Microthyrium microscopicum]
MGGRKAPTSQPGTRSHTSPKSPVASTPNHTSSNAQPKRFDRRRGAPHSRSQTTLFIPIKDVAISSKPRSKSLATTPNTLLPGTQSDYSWPLLPSPRCSTVDSSTSSHLSDHSSRGAPSKPAPSLITRTVDGQITAARPASILCQDSVDTASLDGNNDDGPSTPVASLSGGKELGQDRSSHAGFHDDKIFGESASQIVEPKDALFSGDEVAGHEIKNLLDLALADATTAPLLATKQISAADPPRALPLEDTRLIKKFVFAQRRVISLRTFMDQLHRQRKLMQDNIALLDTEMLHLMQQSSTNNTALDSNEFRRVFEAKQAARDEVGPIDDEIDRTSFDIRKLELDLLDGGTTLQERIQATYSENLDDPWYSSSESTSSDFSFETDVGPASETFNLPIFSSVAHSQDDGSALNSSNASNMAVALKPSLQDSGNKFSSYIGAIHQTEPTQVVPSTVRMPTPSLRSHLQPGVFRWDDNEAYRSSSTDIHPSILKHMVPDIEYPGSRQWNEFTWLEMGSKSTRAEVEPFSKLPDARSLIDDYVFQDDASLLSSFNGTHERINKWLLHKLFSSHMEEAMLNRCLRGSPLETAEFRFLLRSEPFRQAWETDYAALTRFRDSLAGSSIGSMSA